MNHETGERMTTTNETDLYVISSDKVEGTAVFDTGGTKLGSVDDLMIDKRSGQVRYAVMEFGGFLGVGSDRFPIPWKVLKYSNEYGGYVVPVSKEMLKDAPKYAEDAIPPYDVGFGRAIDSYYQ